MISRNKILTLLTLAMLVFGCSQPSMEETFANAKKNFEQGELETAVVQLKGVIAQNVNAGEPRLLLGRIYLRQGQLENAAKELLRAVDLDSKNADVYPYLVKVYYYQEDYLNVIETADRVLPTIDDSAKPTINLYRYLANIRLERSEESIADIPNNLSDQQTKLAQAFAAYLSLNFDEVLEIGATFTDSHPDRVEQQFLLGITNEQLKDYDAAQANFRAVLEDYSNYHLVRFLLVDALIKTEKFDEAEAEVDFLLRVKSDQPEANYFKAVIAFQNKDYETAYLHADRARVDRAANLKNDMVLGLSAYKLDNTEVAYSSLTRVAARLPKTHSVHRLLAQLQLDLGYRVEAAETLSNIQGVLDTDAILFEEVGSVFLRDGDFNRAAEQFAAINKIGEQSAQSELNEGVVKLMARDDRGVANIRESLRLDPSNDQAWLFLAEYYMDKKDNDSALSVARDWQQFSKLGGLILEAQINARQTNWSEAEKLLKEALTLDPESIPAKNNLARILRLDGRKTEFYAFAKQALSENPNNRYMANELILRARQDKDYSIAEQTLTALLAQYPDLENPKLMLSTLYHEVGRHEEAIGLLKDNLDEYTTLSLQAVGDVYYNIGDFTSAREIYNKWRERSRYSIAPWLRLIALEAAAKDMEEMSNLVEEGLTVFPMDEQLNLAKLQHLIVEQRFSDAKTQLNKLNNMGSTNINLLKADGHVAMFEGDFNRAVQMFERFKAFSTHYQDTLNIVIAKTALGEKTEAKALIEALLVEQPESLEVKIKSAEFMSTQGFYDRAIDLYKDLLLSAKNNPVLLNNLANAYGNSGQTEVALSTAEKALEFAPESPQILDTYGWLLYQSGKTLEARATLAVAYKNAPKAPNIAMNYAEVLSSRGENTKAREVLAVVAPLTKKQADRLAKLKGL